MDLLLTNLPSDARRYLRSLVRQDIRKMDRSHPKLAQKFPDAMVRANQRRVYVEAVYAALSVGASAEHTPRGQSDRCTCDPDADGTTDLFCPVHGDSVSFPLTNTVEDEERASWADREPDDPPS